MSPKYPRTGHLPWSPGGTNDDRRIESVDALLGVPLVMTEKMDGSNVCLEQGAVYARSHASAPNHPSFDALKSVHAAKKHLIPPMYQVFGEWLYAKHSIAYDRLPAHLMVFGVRDLSTDTWSSWEEVEEWASELGFPCVPVLSRGIVLDDERDMVRVVTAFATAPSSMGEAREGVVVRVAGAFQDVSFHLCVAKWVRAHHVQTDDHWKTQQIVRNGLEG